MESKKIRAHRMKCHEEQLSWGEAATGPCLVLVCSVLNLEQCEGETRCTIIHKGTFCKIQGGKRWRLKQHSALAWCLFQRLLCGCLQYKAKTGDF